MRLSPPEDGHPPNTRPTRSPISAGRPIVVTIPRSRPRPSVAVRDLRPCVPIAVSGRDRNAAARDLDEQGTLARLSTHAHLRFVRMLKAWSSDDLLRQSQLCRLRCHGLTSCPTLSSNGFGLSA